MKTGSFFRKRFFLLGFLVALASCGRQDATLTKVILEEGDYHVANHVLTLPKGSDFTFALTLQEDKVIADASYKNFTLNEDISGGKRYSTVTFHHVEYSLVITLTIADAVKITYSGNGVSKEEYAVKTHERINVANDVSDFAKDGYCITGWQKGDKAIGLGSRMSVEGDLSLRAIYQKESDVSLFDYEILDDSRAAIKRYLGDEDHVVIPKKIEGRNVVTISEGAFSKLSLEEVVLPPTLAKIGKGGFASCQIGHLVFFDNLSEVDDASFAGSTISKVRINAMGNPAYIRSYYGTYAEKFDRLLLLSDKRKIILYSGSSTRFGFDSEAIDRTFLDYEVVNMGVFAYTPSYPQVEVLSHFVKPGDLIIVSPEFDAIEEQVHLTPVFDDALFAMTETNYDILGLLDLSRYSHFFSAFGEYQYNRRFLNRYRYSDTSYSYDEDGNRVAAPSYNRYGDYVVYRPNNEKRTTFGVKRAFYNKKYFPLEYLEDFNGCFAKLKEKGARLYFDDAPRMDISLSEDSTPSSIEELSSYWEEHVDMAFLSQVGDGLMDPLYFYGTDNHLSSEGVAIRTKKVISALLDQMEI